MTQIAAVIDEVSKRGVCLRIDEDGTLIYLAEADVEPDTLDLMQRHYEPLYTAIAAMQAEKLGRLESASIALIEQPELQRYGCYRVFDWGGVVITYLLRDGSHFECFLPVSDFFPEAMSQAIQYTH